MKLRTLLQISGPITELAKLKIPPLAFHEVCIVVKRGIEEQRLFNDIQNRAVQMYGELIIEPEPVLTLEEKLKKQAEDRMKPPEPPKYRILPEHREKYEKEINDLLEMEIDVPTITIADLGNVDLDAMTYGPLVGTFIFKGK